MLITELKARETIDGLVEEKKVFIITDSRKESFHYKLSWM